MADTQPLLRSSSFNGIPLLGLTCCGTFRLTLFKPLLFFTQQKAPIPIIFRSSGRTTIQVQNWNARRQGPEPQSRFPENSWADGAVLGAGGAVALPLQQH